LDALGQLARRPVQIEIEPCRQLLDPLGRHLAAQETKVFRVVASGEPVVHGRLTRQITHLPMHRDGVSPRVASKHLRTSGRRPEHAREQPQGGRLAGAVRPEIAEDLSRLDLKVEIAEGNPAAVGLGQPLGPHDRRFGHAPTMSSGPHP